jgi:peroxiredoxin
VWRVRRGVTLGLGLTAALVLAGVVGRVPQTAGLREGQPAPAWQAERLDGRVFHSSSLRGRPAVLNFWATWCAPCVEEMPSLERLHRALAPQGLQVIAVSVDDDPLAARLFAMNHDLTLTVLRDFGGRAASAHGADGLPTTVVVDAQGVVQGVYVGAVEWDSPGAVTHLRKLLAAP